MNRAKTLNVAEVIRALRGGATLLRSFEGIVTSSKKRLYRRVLPTS
jgi:hypothetical protein